MNTEAPPAHLVFSCRENRYAVPTETAAEVVAMPPLTRIPGAPPHLLGVFAHRGEVIPVVDLVVLGGGGALPSRRAVLLRLKGGLVALTADAVIGESKLPGRLEPMSSSGVWRHLHGPVKVDGADVMAVDAQALFEFLSELAVTSAGP